MKDAKKIESYKCALNVSCYDIDDLSFACS